MRSLRRSAWLVQQDFRLWWGADRFAAALGIKTRHPERVLNPPDPAMREMSRRCVRVFWDLLTEAQRRIWRKHLVDRDDLAAACADLPRTLIHGDCGVLNTGLRMDGERTELLLIDWEWTAVASPAFDVWYYAISVFPVHAMNMRSALCAYYYDRYLAHGGTAMDEVTWERACALASIFEGLKAFPLFAGAAFCEGSPYDDPSEHETVKLRAAQYTETMGHGSVARPRPTGNRGRAGSVAAPDN